MGLIARIAARNDEDAARRLYRKYRMELFRFGVHVLHDQGLAEEMVQETFIKFCQQAGRYDPRRGPVRGWLFTMAKSAAVDIARRPSSRPLLPVEDFQLPPQYDTVDQALTVLTVDQARIVLPEEAAPKLDSDVVVRTAGVDTRKPSEAATTPVPATGRARP